MTDYYAQSENALARRKCQVTRFIIATAMGLCMVSLAALSSADTLIMRDDTRLNA